MYFYILLNPFLINSFIVECDGRVSGLGTQLCGNSNCLYGRLYVFMCAKSRRYIQGHMNIKKHGTINSEKANYNAKFSF